LPNALRKRREFMGDDLSKKNFFTALNLFMEFRNFLWTFLSKNAFKFGIFLNLMWKTLENPFNIRAKITSYLRMGFQLNLITKNSIENFVK